ncbi:MAG: c-type cytochrome [Leptospirales bacterium]
MKGFRTVSGTRFYGWTLGMLVALLVGILDASSGWALTPGDPVHGKDIYQSYCIQCHGVKGNGKGWAAPAIIGTPANFSDPNFWKGKTDAFLIHVIRRGRKGMPPYWDVMSRQDILDVFSYEKLFRKH